MRALIALLLALVVVSVIPSGAQARRPMTDGLVIASLDNADDWWAALGSPPPCSHASQAFFDASIEPAAAAAAYVSSCVTLWSPAYVRDVRGGIAEATYQGKLWWLVDLCTTAIHERGHNLGYEHMATGIMSPGPWYTKSPGECWRWGESLRAKMGPHLARAVRHVAGRHKS